MYSKILAVLGPILAVFRHYVDSNVIDAVKKAVEEAATHTEWSPGERTDFVINAARAVAAATPTPFDDFAVELAAFLYQRKYAAKVNAAVENGSHTQTEPASGV